MKSHPIPAILIFAALLLLVACAAPAPPPAATATPAPPGKPIIVFEAGTCVYSGPSEFPYGQLEYSWSVQDLEAVQYGLISFSLAEGKTLDDFRS